MDKPVLIFLNRFFHPDLSATSQLLSDLAFHLAGDFRIAVVTSRLRYDDAHARLPARENIGGVDIYRVATTGFGRAGPVGRFVDLVSFHAAAAFTLLGLMRRGDILVAMTDPPLISVVAGAVARAKGAHLVNWLQDIYPEIAMALGVPGLGGPFGRFLRARRNASLKLARENVVLGERMAARARAAGVPAERVRIIPNWADDEAIIPIDHANNPLRQSWGLEGRFVVAYSGNLGRAHEFETLLGAASLLAEETSIVFLMVGDGRHTPALRTAADDAGLSNIWFKPYQARADLAASLGVADVHWISLRPGLQGLILPSKVYGVLAAGRPVLAVTPADGDVARLVSEHGCGMHINPGDSRAFAQAVRELAQDPELTSRLGAAARLAATSRFSRSAAFAQWRETLSTVVSA